MTIISADFLNIAVGLSLVQTEVNTLCIDSCVSSIIEKNFLSFGTAVINLQNSLLHNYLLPRLLNVKWPIIVSLPISTVEKYDPFEWEAKNYVEFGGYVIILAVQNKIHEEIVMDLEESIQHLQLFLSWNPREKFIIELIDSISVHECESIVKLVLHELWKRNIIQVVVLVQLSIETVGLYSWFPYQLPWGNCGVLENVLLLDYWIFNNSNGYFLYDTDLFSNKIPKTIKGCSIRASTAHFPPFSIMDNKNGVSNSISIGGLDVRIVQIIAEKMDMTLDLKPIYDPYPWGKFENGTWIGLRGKLLCDEADIAIAGWANNLQDQLLLEDTERYFTDRIVWYVPRAKPNPRWASIVRVFASLTWIVFFISIFISGIVNGLLSQIVSCFEGVNISNTKINFVLEAWAIVLGVSVPTQPYVLSLRLYFICWVIYSFGINTVFQAFFTSYLVDPGFEHQVSNIDELVESSFRLVLSVYLDEFFDDELLSNPSRKLIMDSPQQCIDFAASNDGVSTMLSRTFVKSEVSGYLANNITFSLSSFVEDVSNIHLVMMVQQGSPFVERMNDIIMHLVEGGIPVKILNEIVNQQHYTSVSQLDSNDYVVMSTSHLQSSFTLFAVGIALSIVSLALELLTASMK